MAPQTDSSPTRIIEPGSYNIQRGPGKLELAYAIMTKDHWLTLQVEKRKEQWVWKVELTALEEMDESKDAFKFKFRLVSTRLLHGIETTWLRHYHDQYSVHGWYNVNAHVGSAQIVPNEG